MNEDTFLRIVAGDVVEVRFTSGAAWHGIVRHVPVATGDSWILETDGEAHYFIIYERMWKAHTRIVPLQDRK